MLKFHQLSFVSIIALYTVYYAFLPMFIIFVFITAFVLSAESNLLAEVARWYEKL